MSDNVVRIRPLLVAPSPAGLTMRFLCEAPSRMRGSVTACLTCGDAEIVREIPSKVVDDIAKAAPIAADGVREDPHAPLVRRVVISAEVGWEDLPCTLSVRVGGALLGKTVECTVDEGMFADLVRANGHAECDPGYHDWFIGHRASASELDSQRARWESFEIKPLISIITPVFKTPRAFLEVFLESMLAQTYPRFELVLVNVSGESAEVDGVLAGVHDERVRIIAAENRSISENTNVGIAASCGDYLGFVDHDDFIEPDALFRYVEHINRQSDCDLLFCDEDHWGEEEGAGTRDGSDEVCEAPDGGVIERLAARGRFRAARLKPGWNPDLLFTHNYVCHLLMVSRRAIELTERSGVDVSAAQDYDLTLKAAEVARSIGHVPRVLYHWRDHPESTSSNRDSKPYALEAGRRAVQGHFDRAGVPAEVGLGSFPFSYRVNYPALSWDDVALIVFGGVGAAESAARELAASLPDGLLVGWCKEEELDVVARQARRPYVVLLDARAQVCGDVWLVETLRQLVRPEIGCSAPLVAEADGIVRSAGLMFSREGAWPGALRGYRSDDCGYMTLLEHARDVTAVPLSCMALRMSDYERVGGLDVGLSGDWAAIDLCLKLRDIGLLTVVQPYAPITMPGAAFVSPTAPEAAEILRRHSQLATGDPYLDPQLDPANPGYRLPHLP